MSITFDETDWPLLRIVFVGAPTHVQFESYLDRRLEYLRREERHVICYDTRQAKLISAEQRQVHAEWMRKYSLLWQQQVLGTAVILTSPFLRLTMNLMLSFTRSHMPPYCVVATPPPAILWAADRLSEAGSHAAAERLRHLYAPVSRSG